MRALPILVALLCLGLALPQVARAGCDKDTDCKGDRVCNAEGRCVDPVPPVCPPCDCADQAAAPPDPTPPPEPTAPPVPDGDTLLITMTDGSPTTGVEITCPSGYRSRASFVEGTVSVPSVPAEACTVHFKGPVNARYGPVRGGLSLLCYIQGATAVCK